MTVRPTPTEAEQAAHARGEHIDEHEPDGSPEQVIHPELKAAADELKKKKLAEAEASKPKVEEVKPAEEVKPPVVEEVRATEADHKRSTYKTRTARREDDDRA